MKRAQASSVVKTLFEAWGPPLVRYAFHMTGSPEVADDVVQEAFLALYRELRRGKKIENPRGWTLRVVRNQVSKHRRRQRRHREQLLPQEVLDAMPVADPGPQVPQWRLDDLTELFSVLSSREEEVLLLRMQSLKYREIAAQLGIGSKSVGTLLARALRKLQRATKARFTGERISNHEEADHLHDDVSKTLQ